MIGELLLGPDGGAGASTGAGRDRHSHRRRQRGRKRHRHRHSTDTGTGTGTAEERHRHRHRHACAKDTVIAGGMLEARLVQRGYELQFIYFCSLWSAKTKSKHILQNKITRY